MTEVRDPAQRRGDRRDSGVSQSARVRLRERRRSGLPTTSRSYGSMVAAVVLVVGAGLIGAVLLNRAGDTTSVLTVRNQVAKGQTIERENLVSAQVAGVKGAVRTDDASSVIGKTAAVGLVPNQVIISQQVTDRLVPGPGLVLVGLALKPSQMPGTGLAAGDLVRVMAVPSAETVGAAELPKAKVLASSGQVYSVTGGDVASGEGSGQVVTVIVASSGSEQLSAYASSGRVVIMKISAGGN